MIQRMASNASAVRRWLETAARDLRDHADLLNDLNVFPVADADTGTNLAITVETASQAMGVLETPDVSELVTLAGQAALEEARGNSGTLFAVFLTAMGGGLEGAERLHAEALANAVSIGSVRAWSALTDPVPGTMLSVLAAAAEVAVPDAGEAGSNHQLEAYLCLLVEAAQQAVMDSTRDLEVLRGTSKVDAGALGLLIILDALRRTVSGQDSVGPELWGGAGPEPTPHPSDADQQLADSDTGQAQLQAPFRPVAEVLTSIGYDLYPPVQDDDAEAFEALKEANTGVEVMATMDMTALVAAAVRLELAETGESVIVSAVSEIDAETWRWRVHVHVPEQHMALSILRRHGSPRNITVTGLTAEPTGGQASAD